MSSLPHFSIDSGVCIRCAASSSIAAPLIALGTRSAAFRRQPGDEREVHLAREAMALCPVGAITEQPRSE